MFFAGLTLWTIIKELFLFVSGISSTDACSHLWGMCPHDYSHDVHTLTHRDLLSCNRDESDTSYSISRPSPGKLYGWWMFPQVHVSSSKSHPLIFEHSPSMQYHQLSQPTSSYMQWQIGRAVEWPNVNLHCNVSMDDLWDMNKKEAH